MSQTLSHFAQLEILDLRHFSAAQLQPLLMEEADRWQRRLFWDYSGSTSVLLKYLDSRVLPGNHVGQPFDIDTFETVTEHIATQTISLPFSVH